MSTDVVQHSDEEDAHKKCIIVAVKRQLDNSMADIVEEVHQQAIPGMEVVITRFCPVIYSRR